MVEFVEKHVRAWSSPHVSSPRLRKLACPLRPITRATAWDRLRDGCAWATSTEV